MSEILVLYYSRYGNVAKMANLVARGVESVEGMQARLRTVPEVSPNTESSTPAVPNDGAPYVTEADFKTCSGLIVGSPTRFGNMAAAMKHCFDQLGSLWASNTLVGKPAAVFTSTGSMHGGQESTLLSMMIPLFHLGYILVGQPYDEKALTETRTGGTPYGPSHLAGEGATNLPISDHEKTLCLSIGKRVATVAKKLG
ncbi:MAG: NAD(P)H-quinone oxidoreductase [Legionellaceae bacterium]|nr:NAD(P)H-quinone oxidoreductase [Legionellaceae bacterium]